MKKVMLSIALASSALLSGCVVSVGGGSDSHYSADWEDREYNNRQHIAALESGMTYESVLRKMGVADFNELFEKQDGTYRVLFYRTQKTMGDGITTKDECTPLVFKNSQLVGWGDSAYALMN
jgi:outer membrane protein assembly factor BamE (lipoprotein component of BamABCDE complex)